AILIATLIPMYSVSIFWPFQINDSITDIIFRSWYLFPILVVPITLLAWQYGYKITLIFIVFTAFFDLPFIVMRIDEVDLEAIQLLGVPILRTIAFGMVGVIVGLLMNTQRLQRKKLTSANVILGQHALVLEELAISRERNRLARELHDTLAHYLSGQILTLEALRLSPPSDNRELQKALSKLIVNSRKGLSETRRALKDLRSKQLEDLGLKTSLELLMKDAASRANCEIIVKIENGIPPTPVEIEQCIYRIAQEGIENIIRYSEASKIELTLTYANNNLIFKLADNGVGFNPDKIDYTEKHGVRGMHERAEEVGGIFRIISSKNKGTEIIAKFEVENDPRIVM
ncbi:MAG: sensor histidine kinase, partial [Anaerolineaceae bacterium]|nr:sensor histidine kinase [Anaerolineaceae bacterium]